MLTIPAELVAKKNALYDPGAAIELLEIVMSELSSTLRLTSNNAEIAWGGVTWTPFPFGPGEATESGEGELPTLEVRVANTGRIVQGYLEQTENGLVGDTVTYRLVHSAHLDKAAYVTEEFQILDSRCSVEWVTFTLGAENFFFRRFPQNVFKRDICRWKVFKGTQCGYAGAATACDRSFAACIALANQARFGGFPGLVNGLFE